MGIEITWDDVPAVRAGTHEPISVVTVLDYQDVKTSTGHRFRSRYSCYEWAWMDWFEIDRTPQGQRGRCLHCPWTEFIPFGRLDPAGKRPDAGALSRCRLVMERHIYTDHVDHVIREVLKGEPLLRPIDPPF